MTILDTHHRKVVVQENSQQRDYRRLCFAELRLWTYINTGKYC